MPPILLGGNDADLEEQRLFRSPVVEHVRYFFVLILDLSLTIPFRFSFSFCTVRPR